MWYRSNTARILWPVTVIATRSGTPALTMFLTVVRRQSWRSMPSTPAALQALFQTLRRPRRRSPVTATRRRPAFGFLAPRRCGSSHGMMVELPLERLDSADLRGDRRLELRGQIDHSTVVVLGGAGDPDVGSRPRGPPGDARGSTSLCIRQPYVYASDAATLASSGSWRRTGAKVSGSQHRGTASSRTQAQGRRPAGSRTASAGPASTRSWRRCRILLRPPDRDEEIHRVSRAPSGGRDGRRSAHSARPCARTTCRRGSRRARTPSRTTA